MKISNFILCLSIIVFQGSYTYAKGKSKSKSKSKSKTSKMLRAKKKFGVSARYGFIAGSYFGHGLEASYNKNSKIQFSLNIQSGYTDMKKNLDNSDPLVQLDKADVYVRQNYVMARYFFGSNFNVGAGLGHRVFEAELAHSTRPLFLGLVSRSLSQKLKVESYAAYLTIGNTWAYENGFFFGFDWIGAAHPLSSRSTVTTTLTSSNSIEDNEIYNIVHEFGEKAAEDIGKATSAMLLVLNIGYMF